MEKDDSFGKGMETAGKNRLRTSYGLDGIVGSGNEGQNRSGGLGLRLRAENARLHTHTQGRRRHLPAGMPPGTSGFVVAIDLGAGGRR